jgi:hypothetical protein
MRILYLDADTLRADHTGPYGYARPTTPNRTALTSGQFGITSGVIGHYSQSARFRLDTGHGAPGERPLLGQHLQASANRPEPPTG